MYAVPPQVLTTWRSEPIAAAIAPCAGWRSRRSSSRVTTPASLILDTHNSDPAEEPARKERLRGTACSSMCLPAETSLR
jgi:hypothetical protein